MTGFPFIEFFTITGAFLIGAISPGPDFAMVLRQSIAHGRRAGIVTSAGIASAILVHGAYTLLGLGLIISKSLLVFSILKYLGAAYLVWLGIGALRAPPPAPLPPATLEAPGAPEPGWLKAFSTGFLTNLLNPKVALFFVALFTTLVSAETLVLYKSIYIVVMAGLLFVWFMLVSVFFTTPGIRAGFYRLGKWFNRVTGLALILLALRLALAQKE